MNRHTLLGLCAILLASVAGCSESPTETLSPDFDLLTKVADRNAVVGSASGSGHTPCGPNPDSPFLCGTDDGSLLRTFSFNARLKADGSVSGRAQFINRDNGRELKVDIDCVRFFGADMNRAWMIGTITHSTSASDPVGLVIGFAVEDNGEGNGADPDRTTGWAPGPPFFVSLICDGGDDGGVPDFAFDNLFSYETVNGNIQVRAPDAS